MLLLFCCLFLSLSAYLVYIVNVYGSRWFGSPYNTHVDARKDAVHAGEIRDRKGYALAFTDETGLRCYAKEKLIRTALSHVVGDTYGQTLGAESMFSRYLYGFDLSYGERLKQYQAGKQIGSHVQLTVDGELSALAAELMEGRWGSIVMLNYKTGELLLSTSNPGFDPEELEAYLRGDVELPGSVMVNRASMGRYTPGSTFKIVTLLAALRNLEGVEERVFSCEGPLAFDAKSGEYLPEIRLETEKTEEGGKTSYDLFATTVEDPGELQESLQDYAVLRDYQDEYHGSISLQEAFASSCNTTFAKLAMEVGPQAMKETAASLGIGEDFLFSDMTLYAANYTPGTDDHDLAWSGVGQYKDLMTPMQMCMLSAAIANDGLSMEPKLLLSVTSPGGSLTYSLEPKPYRQLMSPEEAAILKAYMLSVVESGTGKRAAVEGLRVCGKTGTAEISSDKAVNTHAWFTGFVLEDEHPLAICVILEQAGGGGKEAAPVAAALFAAAAELGY